MGARLGYETTADMFIFPSTCRSRTAAGIGRSSPSAPRTPSSCPSWVWTISRLPHQGSSTASKWDPRASSDLRAPLGLVEEG